MKRWRRLIFYLLINVLVSACTMSLVLYLWGRLGGAPPATVEPRSAAPLQPATPSDTPTPPPPPTPTLALEIYQVQPGDTLGSIALQFDISVDELLRLNGLSDPNTLGSGEVLLVPVTPRPAAPTATETGIPPSPPAPTAAPTIPGQESQVEIAAIVGAGVLQDEHVVIRHTGEGELALANWRLEDSDGNSFTFPQLSLFKDGAVSVYTRAGVNSVVELFWARTETVWQVGELATLRDPQGNARATFQVP